MVGVVDVFEKPSMMGGFHFHGKLSGFHLSIFFMNIEPKGVSQDYYPKKMSCQYGRLL